MEQLTNTTTIYRTRQTEILAKQKDETLAAFYTPQNVAQILTDWALTHSDDTVLDPSYGGCSFLKAAQTTLIKLGSPQPEKQIYGVDIDPEAEDSLIELIGAGARREQFIKEDFFKIDVNQFNKHLFNSVVGNPPYLRYHTIPKAQQKQAEHRLNEYGITISGRASYWAYFLLYSIQFLRLGGRMAMVLPGALLHTDYAAQVRRELTKNFQHVTIYLLQERIFNGTEEESVIICGKGAGYPNESVRIGYVSSVEELAQVIGSGRDESLVQARETSDGGWLRNLLDEDTSHLYDELVASANVIRFGDWIDTRIGVVTGHNKYFIMSEQFRAKRGIPEKHFLRVIKRPSAVVGLTATDADLNLLKITGKDYLLLHPPTDLSKANQSLRKYIEEGEALGVPSAFKCKVRDPWYIVPHTDAPAAFMPCMSASWPRLIVNQSSYTCTNNIFKLSWKEERPASDWIRLALGTLSSLSQLSAELVGRSYGGGVLKLEPKDLRQLAVPILPLEVTEALAEQVDRHIRGNRIDAATEAVDVALIASNSQLSETDIELLRAARRKLFLRRRQHRRDSTRIAP